MLCLISAVQESDSVIYTYIGFPDSSVGKESACNVGDLGSIPWLGRFPGGGYGNPFQYSCLKDFMNRGVEWVTVMGLQSWIGLNTA